MIVTCLEGMENAHPTWCSTNGTRVNQDNTARLADGDTHKTAGASEMSRLRATSGKHLPGMWNLGPKCP